MSGPLPGVDTTHIVDWAKLPQCAKDKINCKPGLVKGYQVEMEAGFSDAERAQMEQAICKMLQMALPDLPVGRRPEVAWGHDCLKCDGTRFPDEDCPESPEDKLEPLIPPPDLWTQVIPK